MPVRVCVRGTENEDDDGDEKNRTHFDPFAK